MVGGNPEKLPQTQGKPSGILQKRNFDKPEKLPGTIELARKILRILGSPDMTILDKMALIQGSLEEIVDDEDGE